MKEVIKDKIYTLVRNSNELLSKTEIAKKLDITVATASKYVDILVAEGKLEIQKVGNVDIVKIKNGGFNE